MACSALLVAQVALGIANVKLALPLHVAVLHNAGAAALLFVLVSLLARVRAPDSPSPTQSIATDACAHLPASTGS